MSDAPERIALIPSDGWSWAKWPIRHQEDAIEYVRADLVALPPAPVDALVKAAEKVVSRIDDDGVGIVLAVELLALRAALAAIREIPSESGEGRG